VTAAGNEPSVTDETSDLSVEVVLPDAEATRALGLALAGLLPAGDMVALTGPLGAGNATLTQDPERGRRSPRVCSATTQEGTLRTRSSNLHKGARRPSSQLGMVKLPRFSAGLMPVAALG